MRHLITIILVITSFTEAKSQSKGYMGRPLSIQYEFATVPNLRHPNANNKIVLDDGVSLSSFHRLAFNYQSGRKASLGIAFGYSLTGMDLNRGLSISDESSSDATRYYGYFEQVEILSLEFRYSRFFTSIAPVGPYWSFFAGISNAGFRDGTVTLKTIDYPADHIDFDMDSRMRFYSGIRLGKQKILFDRITFSYSVELDLFYPFVSIYHFVRNPFYGEESRRLADEEEEEFINITQVRLRDRVRRQGFILFNLTFGILAP